MLRKRSTNVRRLADASKRCDTVAPEWTGNLFSAHCEFAALRMMQPSGAKEVQKQASCQLTGRLLIVSGLMQTAIRNFVQLAFFWSLFAVRGGTLHGTPEATSRGETCHFVPRADFRLVCISTPIWLAARPRKSRLLVDDKISRTKPLRGGTCDKASR